MYLGTPTLSPLLAPTGPQFGTAAYEAERLDRLFPGWWEQIDLSKLEMGSASCCILGQGCPGGYGPASDIVDRDATLLGQNTDYFQYYLYDETIPEWTVEIEKRRAA